MAIAILLFLAITLVLLYFVITKPPSFLPLTPLHKKLRKNGVFVNAVVEDSDNQLVRFSYEYNGVKYSESVHISPRSRALPPKGFQVVICLNPNDPKEFFVEERGD